MIISHRSRDVFILNLTSIKGKVNDLKGYEQVITSIHHGIKPLVELTPFNQKKTTTANHIKDFVRLIKRFCSIKVPFVDLYGLLPDEIVASGENATLYGFRLLHSQGVKITPTYGLQRNDLIWSDLRDVVSAFDSGFCFRLSIDDLDDQASETWDQIIQRTAELDLLPSDVDIILDLRHIGESPDANATYSNLVPALKELVIDFLSYNPEISEYRSIILCGSSALKTVGRIPKDGMDEVKRVELRLWATLFNDLADSVLLRYGDYGVIHPDFSDASEIKRPNPSAKLRRTVGDNIIYFRGHGLFKPNKDFEQYHSLAKKLITDSRYQFARSSVADDYLYRCANYLDGPGNLQTWVWVDMNHHITYTAKQIQKIWQVALDSRSETDIEREVISI